MATFNEIMSGIKTLLKRKLDNENLELFTEVDKELDKLSESHTQTESDLSKTKDKLIEVVKSASFKDSEPEDNHTGNTEDPMTIDEAINASLDEILANRK